MVSSSMSSFVRLSANAKAAASSSHVPVSSAQSILDVTIYLKKVDTKLDCDQLQS